MASGDEASTEDFNFNQLQTGDIWANFVIQGFFLRYVYKIYVDNKEELG